MSEDFDARGWAVARGVLEPEQLAPLVAAFDLIIPPGARYPATRKGVVWEVGRPSMLHDAFARLLRDPALARLATETLGWARVQFLDDTLVYKPAREGGTVEWHQDYTYVGFLEPANVISLRVALEDEDEASGCVRVVDGSHAWGPLTEVRLFADESVTSPRLSPEQAARLAHARALELSAGDASIHHCLTLHQSGPNVSDRPRKTLVLRLCDAACVLVPERIPEHARGHFPTTSDGHLAPHAFPLL